MFRKSICVGVLALLFFGTAQSADFEKSLWRAQVYSQVVPWYPVEITGSLRNYQRKLVPLSFGFLLNPLFTPAYKADLPFGLWIGAEVANIQWAELEDLDNPHERLNWQTYWPALVGGLNYNIAGRLDVRLQGGFGFANHIFDHELVATNRRRELTHKQHYGLIAFEYVLGEVWEGADLKLGVFYRQDTRSPANLQAVARHFDDGISIVPQLSGLSIHRLEQTSPKFGVELSLDFGRESRKDRRLRFALRDRDAQLRKYNAGMDTLQAWDCMALERDYNFFLVSGQLPDVRHKFTRAQYADVLESFLAFCKPEDLRTKNKLYAELDSAKIQLKSYQVTQEDTRHRQVMSSNDPNMLRMFLQYYPDSRHRTSVESKLRILEDFQAFRNARQENSFRAFLSYLNNFPQGHYRREAETGIFQLVRESNKITDYEIYLRRFPEGLFVQEARRGIHALTRQGSSQILY